jgi:hypothetical protein
MKINVDGQEVFELSATQKRVIQNDISEDIFDADMKRRLEYILTHKYEQCYKRLKDEWEPRLAARGVQSLPTNRDAFAQLVFSQPDYQDRKTRESASTERVS